MKVLFVSTFALAMAVLSIQLSVAAGWSKGQTVTSITENNVNGEVVQITVTEIIDNSAHCANPPGYAIRDTATVKGTLALLTSALMISKPNHR
jgi:hypothetical protein